MDKMQLIELALNALGEKEFKEGSANEKPCMLEYDSAVREAFGMHAWSFAKRMEPLSAKDNKRYDIPPDCLRLLELRTSTGSKVKAYQLVGAEIVLGDDSDGSELSILYISDSIVNSGNLPDRAPYFIRGVIYLLASHVAVSITGHTNMVEGMAQLAREAFSQAMTIDSRQDSSNDQHPIKGLLERNIFKG